MPVVNTILGSGGGAPGKGTPISDDKLAGTNFMLEESLSRQDDDECRQFTSTSRGAVTLVARALGAAASSLTLA
jgi:hypothetical protein